MILKKKYIWFYLLLLMFSYLFMFFVNSYYMMWIIMELNLILFITLVVINNKYVMDKVMKYFLINSFSSMIFLFFMNYNMFMLNNNLLMIIMNMMMLMKLGFVPFHFWFIDLMISLDWMMCFVLSTLQKLIPMLIIMMFINLDFIYLMSMFNGLLSIFMILNQMLLKKFFGYSSINHMSWMMFCLLISFKVWLLYYFSYLMINFCLMYMFWKFNFLEFLNFYNINLNLNHMYYMMFLMMSLGGLPPFYGFMIKWWLIMKMMNLYMYLFMMMLIFYSLFFLFYYLRLMYNIMMINYINLKINYDFYMIVNYNFGWNIFMNFSILGLMYFFMWFVY